MTREEKQTWALVGGGAVIIILLLLDFGQPSQSVSPQTGGLIWPPFDPITFNITKVPPNGYPFYLNITDINKPPDQILPGTPCGCGCGTPQYINGLDLTSQLDQLNTILQTQAYNLTTTFYAGEPPWATNSDQIAAFNAAEGLPPPF